MKHEEGEFEGVNNTKLYYQSWTPDEDPKGIVLIIHGFGEHSGRYTNVIDTLVPEGFAVWGLDHRGHGKSEGKKVHVNRFAEYLDDLQIFEGIAREKYPDLPFHMVGHSMGSLIANHYMATRADQNKFKTLTLSGTGAAPGPAISAFTRFISKILSGILPKISVPSNLDPNFISHDEEVIKAYMNDPLVYYQKITPRLANEMMKYVSNMRDVAPNLTVSTLMQLGSEDEAFHPDTWQPLHEAIGSDKKELKVYEGYRHEVYNEVKKEVPLNDLKEWINQYNNV